MANLQSKKLSFKETFRGFHLKIEFECVPVSDNPTSKYDYNVLDPRILTCSDNIDVVLLVNSHEKIIFDVEQAIPNKVHKLYMDELTNDRTINQLNHNQLTH